MEYRINIVRQEPDPGYKEELKKYEENSRYRGNPYDQPRPQEFITKDVLITVLSEAQYKAVQEAVLKTF